MKCNIGYIRKSKGLQQKFVAKQIGITPEHLSHIERDKSEASAGILFKIAKVLDCKVDDLYTLDDE